MEQVWQNSRKKTHFFPQFCYVFIATLGPSEKFSLAEDLASLSLQDGPQSGNIITEPASQPLNRLHLDPFF